MKKDEFETVQKAFDILKKFRPEVLEAGDDEGAELIGEVLEPMGELLFMLEGNCE